MARAVQNDMHERSPLVDAVTSEQGKTVVFVGLSVVAYIVCSAALINYNKFLMHEDRFPHSIALTWLHMASNFCISCLLYACFGTRLYPTISTIGDAPGSMMKKLVPLSLCFAVSIVLSNEAYMYCSVPFLQMCKELNVALVYCLSLAVGLEIFHVRTGMILLVVCIGCGMAIHGEMRFSMVGFMIQFTGQCAEAIKIVTQQIMMQGSKLDPLTMVLIMSPLCLVTLSIMLCFMWEPNILAHGWALSHHLAMNCACAFALNVAVASVIKYASGTAFVLAGVVKDISIVVAASLFFTALISPIQWVGFCIAVGAIGMHSLLKSLPNAAEKRGIVGTMYLAFSGRGDLPREEYVTSKDPKETA